MAKICKMHKWLVGGFAALITMASPAFGSNWEVSESISPMDDSRRVILSNESNEEFRDSHGRYGRAKLWLRCIEGRTTFLLNFNDSFLSDRNGFGAVQFRLDKEPAFTRNMTVSTNNMSLGFWRSLAIPAMTELYGHETLTVRAAPYNQSPITVSFDIQGVEEEIAPLRDACNW